MLAETFRRSVKKRLYFNIVYNERCIECLLRCERKLDKRLNSSLKEKFELFKRVESLIHISGEEELEFEFLKRMDIDWEATVPSRVLKMEKAERLPR